MLSTQGQRQAKTTCVQNSQGKIVIDHLMLKTCCYILDKDGQ